MTKEEEEKLRASIAYNLKMARTNKSRSTQLQHLVGSTLGPRRGTALEDSTKLGDLLEAIEIFKEITSIPIILDKVTLQLCVDEDFRYPPNV